MSQPDPLFVTRAEPAARLLSGEGLVKRRAEAGGIDRGIAIQVRRDGLEDGAQLCGIDHAAAQHLVDVGPILHVAPLNFGERLRGQFEVMERQRALPGDESAAVFPARPHRNEIDRRAVRD